MLTPLPPPRTPHTQRFTGPTVWPTWLFNACKAPLLFMSSAIYYYRSGSGGCAWSSVCNMLMWHITCNMVFQVARKITNTESLKLDHNSVVALSLAHNLLLESLFISTSEKWVRSQENVSDFPPNEKQFTHLLVLICSIVLSGWGKNSSWLATSVDCTEDKVWRQHYATL